MSTAVAPAHRREWPTLARPSAGALRAVLVSWLAARAVVALALAFSAYLGHEARNGAGPDFHHSGLLGWDAAYYHDLAQGGYGSLPVTARRFFPLLPLVVRILGLGHAAGPVQLVVVNLAAAGYAVALLVLLRAEGWDERLGERAVWLLALTPPAFVLVTGYAEALAGLFAVLTFLGLRTGRFGLAAGAGLLAGLCRPAGILLALPALIEVLREPKDRPLRRVAAVLAPVAGTALYLAYIGLRFGDPLQPLRIQEDRGLHGPARNPVSVVVDAARGLTEGHIGTGLHVPWVLLFLGLLVVMVRRLPASYSAWAVVTLLSALTGSNLDSLERYCWNAFPFLVGAALLLGRRLLWQGALVVSGALLASYALLSFLGLAVP